MAGFLSSGVLNMNPNDTKLVNKILHRIITEINKEDVLEYVEDTNMTIHYSVLIHFDFTIDDFVIREQGDSIIIDLSPDGLRKKDMHVYLDYAESPKYTPTPVEEIDKFRVKSLTMKDRYPRVLMAFQTVDRGVSIATKVPGTKSISMRPLKIATEDIQMDDTDALLNKLVGEPWQCQGNQMFDALTDLADRVKIEFEFK